MGIGEQQVLIAVIATNNLNDSRHLCQRPNALTDAEHPGGLEGSRLLIDGGIEEAEDLLIL